MKKILGVLGIVAAIALSIGLYQWFNPPQRLVFSVLDGVDFQLLLPAEALEEYASILGSDFAVSSERRPLVLLDEGLVEVHGWKDGALEAAPLSEGVKVRHFALDDDGAVWALTDKGLGTLTAGKFHQLVPLPDEWRDAHLLVSKRQRKLFLYGGDGGPQKMRDGIVAVRANGTAEFLVESPNLTVVAACDTPHGLLIATSSELLYLEGERLQLVLRLEWLSQIISVAYSAKSNTVFYAFPNKVYALKGLDAISLAQGIGGELRYASGSLYVLDREHRVFVRLDKVDEL